MTFKQPLGKLVQAYLSREGKSHGNVEIHPFDKVGLYQFTSGTKHERGGQSPVRLYHGKFIDVVATIVKDKEYGGWWESNPSGSGNGYIRLVEPTKVGKVPNLREYISTANELAKRKSELESMLDDLNDEMANKVELK